MEKKQIAITNRHITADLGYAKVTCVERHSATWTSSWPCGPKNGSYLFYIHTLKERSMNLGSIDSKIVFCFVLIFLLVIIIVLTATLEPEPDKKEEKVNPTKIIKTVGLVLFSVMLFFLLLVLNYIVTTRGENLNRGNDLVLAKDNDDDMSPLITKGMTLFSDDIGGRFSTYPLGQNHREMFSERK
jgi:hypothetical protein